MHHILNNKSSKALGFGVIFFLVFFVLGIPYVTIGFDSDCFGLVFFSAQIKSFHDLLFCLLKPIQSSYKALNEMTASCQEGFLTYFRPMMTLSHYVCYHLFGFNPYAYHLVNVGLHALTTGTLFYVFTFFMLQTPAFCLALLFAVHPALTPAYIGVTSHVVPGYLAWALTLLAYAYFLQTDKRWWYCLAVFFFLISLLSYEIIIVFPILLTLYLIFFGYDQILYRSFLFLATTFGYLVARFALLGMPALHEKKIFAVSSLPQKIFGNWHQAIKPFWGLQNSSKFFVIVISLLFLSSFLVTWYQATHRRKLLIFYTLCFFILAWPISLITADGRYFYPAIPFFLLIGYEIWRHSKKKLLSFYGTTSMICIFCVWSLYHDVTTLVTRSFITHRRDTAFKALVDYYKPIPDLRLIMVGTLHCYQHDTLLMQQGMTQAARLFFNNPNLEAFHVTEAKIYVPHTPSVSFIIKPLSHGFRFISPSPEELFFMIPQGWQEETPIPFSMGHCILHKKHDSWKASDISFIFDASWLLPLDRARTKFVTFDVKNWCFVELTVGEP